MVEISVNAYNIRKMCRLCLSTGVTLLNIFQCSTKTKNTVADVIMKFAPVQIKKYDEMPNFICRLCYTQVEKSHQFQVQIVESDRTLRRYLHQLHASDKQIKSEGSENLSIYSTNTDISVQSLNLTECADDTAKSFSKNDGCEISSEDTKNDFGNRKLIEDIDISWKDKEPVNINSENKVKEETTSSFGTNDEPIIYDNSLSLQSADDTLESISKSYGSEISCDPKIDIDSTSENFERPCSADVTEDFDKSENTSVDNVIHKEASKMKYKCDFCNKCFLYPSSLFRHRRSHTGEKPYECDVCNKCFSQSRTLKIHKRLHSGEKPHQCHVCNKHFTQLSNLIIHKRMHSGEKRDDIIKDSEKRKLGNKNVSIMDITSKNSHKIDFKCDFCSKCFSDLFSLSKHKRIHKKQHQCDICNKQFSGLSNLNRHKFTHTGEKPFLCDVCSKCFSNSDHLKIHKRIHTGEKPYHCEICNRHFAYLHGLKRHNRTHTGEKPYHCDVCNKQFVQSTHLKVHKRTHTGEKPYQCDVCNKRFASSGCVSMHKRTHTGERPYQCDFCNMNFVMPRHLKTHRRIHTGEKPYRCDVCNMCFTYSFSLNKHMTKHS